MLGSLLLPLFICSGRLDVWRRREEEEEEGGGGGKRRWIACFPSQLSHSVSRPGVGGGREVDGGEHWKREI